MKKEYENQPKLREFSLDGRVLGVDVVKIVSINPVKNY